MNFLFIDGYCDLRFLKENNRINNINNVLVLYASVLKYNNYHVSIIDAREKNFNKQFLDALIIREQYDIIIWGANHDNIKNINNWHEKHKNVISIVLSQNYDYSKLPFFSSTLLQFIFDERKDLQHNVEVFFKLLNIGYKEYNYLIDYSLYPNLKTKTVNINIGYGCQRSCDFCSIANTISQHRPVKDVICEIRAILNAGVNFFHIANHNFFSNPTYVKELCTQLINEFSTLDYGWSCFIVPEFIENHLELLQLLRQAKLLKIEIGVERVGDNPHENLNIPYSSENLLKIMKAAISSDIPSIAINYIIGTPFDSTNYLDKLHENILMVLSETQGCCDINFYRLYNTVSTNITTHKYDLIETTQDSDHIIKWQRSMGQEIYEFRKKIFHHLSLIKLYQHSNLTCYSIQTQIWIDIIRQTFFHVLYKTKKNNNSLYFSWEITDDIENYAPVMYARALYKEGKRYITIPNYLASDNRVQLLEIDPNIYHYIKSTLTIKEMMERFACSPHYNPSIIKDEILKILQKLESLHMVLYTKILN